MLLDLIARLNQYAQSHLLAFFHELTEADQRQLLSQVERIDFELLAQLYREKDHPSQVQDYSSLQPITLDTFASIPANAKTVGEAALKAGEVAILLVAGGQGSRLGFEHPKGMFPIGPVSNKSLFQIHAEKVLALGRKYGKPLPFLIMTSPATDAETRAFFQQHHYFGLPENSVHFFVQGTMPALDLQSGKVLLDAKNSVFTSPNGHGGTLLALKTSGLLDQLHAQGIVDIFYLQVDNPLVTMADPHFLGGHRLKNAEISSRAIAKAHAEERMGVLVNQSGRCAIVEYSDMPKDLMYLTDESGQLVHRAGSPAIHLFSLAFLQNLLTNLNGLPYHFARKKVPYVNEQGEKIQPEKENALKFEMFIFDALPMAQNWFVLEADRAEEFAPVKNASGADSPATAKAGMTEQFARWFEQNGVRVQRDADGKVPLDLEISPTFALSAEDLSGKVEPGKQIDRSTYWGD